MYAMHNVRFSNEEFPEVVKNFANGLLPLGLFKYYDGTKTISSIPECPAEGAEILVMPNDKVFAVFKGGKWHITNKPYYPANHTLVTAKMLPSINGIPTV